MGDGASHIVLRRPFDDDPDREAEPRWEKIGFANSRAEAVEIASDPFDDDGYTVAIKHGDLILALPIDSLNVLLLNEAADSDLFVVDKSGYVAPAPTPSFLAKHPTWLAGWEGVNASADLMLKEAVPTMSIIHARIMLAACEVAKEGLVVLSTDDKTKAATLIETASAWALGRVSEQRLKMAELPARAARDRANQQDLGIEYWALDAAVNAATCTTSRNRAAEAARSAALCLPMGTTTALRGMAPLVRKWIPLPVLLLGYLGESVPLGTILRLRLGDGPPPDLSKVIPKGYV